MARRKQSRGTCMYCGREMAKGGMSRHLPACPERQKTIDNIKQKTGPEQLLFHLRAEDAYGGHYWLNLEMNGTAPLTALDSYLRAIWLECCGHLSDFFMGGAWRTEIDMAMRADQIFQPETTLTHIYDFGTSSETTIKVVEVRRGKPTTPHPIALMARNKPIEETCMECDQPATYLCMECIYEYDTPGTLCDVHAREHPHDDYGGLMPLVNSPRTGLCGYTGPAEPPY